VLCLPAGELEVAVLAEDYEVIICVKTHYFSLHQMARCARFQLPQQPSVTVSTIAECCAPQHSHNNIMRNRLEVTDILVDRGRQRHCG